MFIWINRKLTELLRASAREGGLSAHHLARNILDHHLGLSEREQHAALTELARRVEATKRARELAVRECQDYEVDKELYLQAKARRQAMREEGPESGPTAPQ